MKVPRIDAVSARERLLGTELMLAAGKQESVTDWIEYARKYLLPSFFLPSQGMGFDESLIEVIAEYTLHLLMHESPRLRKASEDLWKHVSAYCAALSPQRWLETITPIVNNETYIEFLWVLCGGVSDALTLLRKDQRLKHWPVVNKLIMSLNLDRLSEVKMPMWELFGMYATPQNLEAILAKIGRMATFSDVLAKLAGLRNEAMDKVLEGFDIPFILNVIRRMETSKRPELAKIGPTLRPFCMDEHNSQGELAIMALRLCLLRVSTVSESDREILMPVVEAAKHIWTSKSGHNPSQYLDFLRTAAVKKLITREELVKLMELGSSHLSARMTSVKIFVENCELALNEENVREQLMAIAREHETDAYKQLLTLGAQVFEKIVKIDEDFAFQLATALVVPYPRDPSKTHLAVKMVSAMPPTALVDPRFGLNLQHFFNVFSMSDKPSVIEAFAKLVRKVDIDVNYCELDLFGKYAAATYQYATDFDEGLLREILESRIAEPTHLKHILGIIAQNKTRGHIFYAQLVSLLRFELTELGLNVPRIFSIHRLTFDKSLLEHPWISESDLHSLFENITEDFYKSEFALLVKATLDALVSLYDYSDVQKEYYLKMAAMVSWILEFFPVECSQILSKFLETGSRVQDDAVKLAITKIMERVNQMNPQSGFSEYVSLLIKHKGFDNVYAEKKEYVELAASTDREFAKTYAKNLKQPLPIMDTFLSFVNIKEHESWIDVCQHTLPPHDWVATPDDLDLIKALPQTKGSDVIHQAILDILKTASERNAATAERNGQPVTRQRVFTFKEVELETLDVKIHETEPATIANLVSYLWHIGGPLPEGFSAEKLEEIAFAHPSHAKLLASFFLWAQRHNYQIDCQKWAQKIDVSPYDKYAVLALAAFFGHVKGKFQELSKPLQSLILFALESAGKPSISKVSIVGLFRSGLGPKWLLARNLMLIDPQFWDEFPVIRAVATHDIESFKSYLTTQEADQSYNFELYWGLSQLFFELDQRQLLVGDWPVCYEFLPRMMKIRPESYLPVPVQIDPEILGAAFAGWQKGRALPYDQINIFYSMALDPPQISALEKLLKFEKSTDILKHFIPGLFDFGGRAGLYNFNDELHKDVSNFFANKPPSYTRRYVRSSLLLFKRRMSREFESILLKEAMTMVHPALLYAGTATFGVRTWKSATSMSLLRYGIFSDKIYQDLLDVLGLHSMEAVDAAFLLTSLPDDYLKIGVPLGNVAMAREQMLRILVNATAAPGSDLWHAVQVINLLLGMLKPDDVLMLICNRIFVNQPHFLCAYFVFRFFERSLTSEDTKDFAEFCQVFHDPESGMFTDPRKTKVFANARSLESIAAALHEIVVPDKEE